MPTVFVGCRWCDGQSQDCELCLGAGVLFGTLDMYPVEYKVTGSCEKASVVVHLSSALRRGL